jgi:outer membrane protein TolC
MNTRNSALVLWAALGFLAAAGTPGLRAQEALPPPAAAQAAPVQPGVVHLTLEQAKERALTANKGIALGNVNIESKEYAVKAIHADYFPKVIGNSLYFHFDNPLGSIESVGRLTGGMPISRAFLNQDSSLSSVDVVQPLTALLKVRQGVLVALADKQIAQADLEKGIRTLLGGVEQLYWGILAARRIRAGALAGVQGAEELAATKTTEARLALLQARQGLQQVEAQIADLEAQLVALLELPPCTHLELEEPPVPVPPEGCAEDVAALAVAASPEVRSAEQDVVKAHAAVKVAKVDYLPNVVVLGGFAKQTGMSYIQQDINYVGVTGSYTFFEWGKKKYTVRQSEKVVVLAELKLEQTRDDVRQKALKAFREVGQTRAAFQTAQEMVTLRQEAARGARTLPDKMAAAKALLEAEVDLVKADLAYRVAVAELLGLVGKP